MPRAENNFGEAQLALLKNIENERIMGEDIFTSRNAQKRGLDYDIRRDVYAQAKNMKLDNIAQFFNQHIKNRSYTYLILGDPAKLDMKYLESLGEVRQLSLNEIFGY